MNIIEQDNATLEQLIDVFNSAESRLEGLEGEALDQAMMDYCAAAAELALRVRDFWQDGYRLCWYE